jgi:hypothetical protein
MSFRKRAFFSLFPHADKIHLPTYMYLSQFFFMYDALLITFYLDIYIV